MTNPSTVAVYQADLTPLRGRWGRAWAVSLGAEKDATIERARQAVLAGAVTRAPEDALPLLGADVALEQLPGEDSDTYRGRIAKAWVTWPWAGTRYAVEQYLALSFVGGAVYVATEWGLTPWAQWWLVIAAGSHPWTSDGAWDDAGTWDDGGTWDSTAAPTDVARVRLFLRPITNARDVGHVRLSLGTTDYYDDGGVWDGTGADVWNDEQAFIEWRI